MISYLLASDEAPQVADEDLVVVGVDNFVFLGVISVCHLPCLLVLVNGLLHLFFHHAVLVGSRGLRFDCL